MDEPVAMPQTAEQKKREAEYQAEDDLRTLSRAAQVKNDPKRLKAARAMARKQMAELKSVDQG